MKRIFLFFTVLVCAAVTGSAAQRGWVKLFNGKDLQGWVQRGGNAKYEAKDGVIVGTTVLNTPNSFLCTEKEYGDFILELEFKVNPVLNSGVQFRSEVFDYEKAMEIDGKVITVPAGRVHGYQAEIDMDPEKNRWWVGGIYDEARRAWLFPGPFGGNGEELTKAGVKIVKQNGWNKLKIEARGDSIKTYLNGKLRASIKDSMTPKGFIALQVHSVGRDRTKEGLTVEWRNIRLKEIGK